jgi:cold shock CspA family protein
LFTTVLVLPQGFGFIKSLTAEFDDVFVHQTGIMSSGFRSLGEGESVEFKVKISERTGKYQAYDVTGPDGAEPQGAPQNSNRGGGGGGGGW